MFPDLFHLHPEGFYHFDLFSILSLQMCEQEPSLRLKFGHHSPVEDSSPGEVFSARSPLCEDSLASHFTKTSSERTWDKLVNSSQKGYLLVPTGGAKMMVWILNLVESALLHHHYNFAMRPRICKDPGRRFPGVDPLIIPILTFIR